MPPKSTELRVEHFDEQVYTATPDTILYKFLDAMCGDAGAGSLKKEIFLQRLSGALEGVYGNDLDYIFGNVRFLSRTGSESYTHDTMKSMLTSDQWDEVRVKDAAYRARIKEFFIAAAKGNTVEGVRQAVHAATSADCQVLESWRYYDSFGLTQSLGRATGVSYTATNLTTGHRVYFDATILSGTATGGTTTTLIDSTRSWTVNAYKGKRLMTRSGAGAVQDAVITANTATTLTVGTTMDYAPTGGTSSYSIIDGNPLQAKSNATAYVTGRSDSYNWLVEKVQARSELTVVPSKQNLTPHETRLLRSMLDRITPQDSVVTISTEGLSVHVPVKVATAAADSCYFQVEKTVTPTPMAASLPAPELLAIDLDPTERWLWSKSAELAPYAQFNITQEYGYFYLVSGGARSPIDSVGYGTLNDDGTVSAEKDFEWFVDSEQYGAWTSYDLADSPDNYPGGKQGLNPNAGPAKNPDRSSYRFPYPSQAAYVAVKKAEVLSVGGQAEDQRYRLPIEKPSSFRRTFTPDLAIAYTAPIRDSTVTSSWTSRRTRNATGELRNPSSFVKA
jgi:hypothetical protein